MTTTNSACSWDEGRSVHLEKNGEQSEGTHTRTRPAPPQASTSFLGWEKKDGLEGSLPEKGDTAILVRSWKPRPQPGFFKVLDQKGLVGTSDLTGCQHSNITHAYLQDALQILSY